MKIKVPDYVCDSHVHVGEYFTGIELSFPIESLLKITRKYKIDKVLVSSSEMNTERENKFIVKKATNNPHIYALIRERAETYKRERFLKSLEKTFQNNDKIVGLKVNPSTEKHTITDPIYKRALEILNDHSLVILLHCGRWIEMSGWHYGIEIAKRYPKIKVILAHMGGTHPDLSFPAIQASRPLNNVYMDTSQTRQLIVLKRGIEKLGVERILFGSDMPWGDYLQNLIGVLQFELKESDLNKVLRQNFCSVIAKES